MSAKKLSKALVSKYVRMWPREIFHRVEIIGKGKGRLLTKELKQPGVYILYRDDEPYYVGQAENMRGRISQHATNPTSRIYLFWNFFSAFVVENPALRTKVEGILIAAMPTANSSNPKLPRETMPKSVRKLLLELRQMRAAGKM